MKTKKQKTKYITAVELLTWVLEHRKAYPLEAHEDFNHDSYDELGDFANHSFDFCAFVTVTKADFARRYGNAAPSQVSRWIAAGALPVRPDGRINYREGCYKVENYQDRCEQRQKEGWR
jgi:hypothetical protein